MLAQASTQWPLEGLGRMIVLLVICPWASPTAPARTVISPAMNILRTLRQNDLVNVFPLLWGAAIYHFCG